MTDTAEASSFDSVLAASIVEGSEDAIIGLTTSGQIETWNPGAQLLFGYSPTEALGRHASMLLAPGREDEFAKLLARATAGERIAGLQTARKRKDGEVIDVSVTLSPVRDASGHVIGASTVAANITEHQRVETARARALSALEEAQRLARLGSWAWDPRSDEASWSPQMYEIFGRDASLGPATSENFFEYVHADDRERVSAGYCPGIRRRVGLRARLPDRCW